MKLAAALVAVGALTCVLSSLSPDEVTARVAQAREAVSAVQGAGGAGAPAGS